MSACDTFNASALKKMVSLLVPDHHTNPSSWDPVYLYILLAAIVQASNGILDSKYSQLQNLPELLNTHPNLREALVAAWNNQDYSEVLNIPFLRPEISVSLPLPHVAKAALSREERAKLASEMRRPYRGVAVDALYQYLEQNNIKFHDSGIKPRYYAKFCSVVQSSGTGKTRTILELARRGVLLLYMNLQPIADESSVPDRDNIPAKILTGDYTSETDYHNTCCALFGAIFKLVTEDLSARLESTDAAAVESWNNDIGAEPYRTIFFERLQNACNQIKKDIECKLHAQETLYAKDIRGATRPSRSQVAVNEIIEYYTPMINLFQLVFPGMPVHKPKLVIALDEAHPLREPKLFDRSMVLFRIIKSYSARGIFEESVWVLFASTTSRVADSASPHLSFNSARVSSEGQLIFPPFCEIGWDKHAPPLKGVPPDDIAKAKHILQYGRPLWVSLKAKTLLGEIFAVAEEKLIGEEAYNANDPAQTLAVLGQRFVLDVCFGHREATAFVQSAVASHLRVSIATTDDRMWTYATYPSEPFLSCAATHLLHKDPASLGKALGVLKGKVDSGMIDIGQRGELVNRLLWLLAKDLFVIHEKNSRQLCTCEDGLDTELFHCSMIPVVPFFKFVFGENFWLDRAGPEAEQAFKDAYVNFSHWISMESFIRQDDGKAVDQLSLDEWTMRHLQRTCAIQCCHNQPDIDQVIPIYFKSVEQGQSGSYRVSQILISDKARIGKQSNTPSKIRRTAPTIGGKHQGSLKPLPYIAIVADLGLRKPELEVTFATRSSVRTGTDVSCLRIRACALAPETYPFLEGNPEVLQVLQHLVLRQETPDSERPLVEYLRDQVKYGNSAEPRHMAWEKGSSSLLGLNQFFDCIQNDEAGNRDKLPNKLQIQRAALRDKRMKRIKEWEPEPGGKKDKRKTLSKSKFKGKPSGKNNRVL